MLKLYNENIFNLLFFVLLLKKEHIVALHFHGCSAVSLELPSHSIKRLLFLLYKLIVNVQKNVECLKI